MDKILKEEKREYGVLENVWYLVQSIFKEDKFLFVLILIQIPATILIPLLGIYLPKVVVDNVVKEVSLGNFFWDTIPIILGIVLSSFIVHGTEQLIDGRGSVFRMGYINRIGFKAIDTDYENIDGAHGQTKIQKATMSVHSDYSAVQAIVKLSVDLSSNLIGLILYAGLILNLHPLIMIFIFFSAIINYFVSKYVNKYEYKNKDKLAPVEKKLKYIRVKTGDFESAKDMRLYKMSPWFKDMYGLLIKEKLDLKKKENYRKYGANLVDGLLILFRDALAYGFLIYSVLYGDMEVADFILYFGIIGGISVWLSGIVKNLNDINSFSLNINDLRDYLETEDKSNRGQGMDLPKDYELPCDIELKDLYFKYEGAKDYTIKGLNLHIKKGEKLALVGLNGAGKTTLVKLLSGLYRPSKGQIYLNGREVKSYNRDDYYSLFSVVFQDSQLLPISIERNIASSNEDEIDRKKMDQVLDMSGLKDKVDSLSNGASTLLVKSVYEEAIDFSGGEMQKLMLARALYKDAPIMILDEPTAALDPIAENEIYRRYNDLTREKTSIFISHRLSSTRFCDRIVFLEEGKIIEEGSHQDLMKLGGSYREIYDMQSHYYQDTIGGGANE